MKHHPSEHFSRRRFLRQAGVSAAAANFALNLPSLSRAGVADAQSAVAAKKRLIFVFSPNGVVPDHFWPDRPKDKNKQAKLQFKRILKPLEPFRDQTVTMHGLCNQIRGDGDGHMRGIGCLLTGVELFPGDIQGGSDTPAGWSMGISIDQFLKNQLQAEAGTRTRFGSLEFGVMVPDRADTWTRMSYAGPNQPVAPIDDPYKMFDKLYGQAKNREMLSSVLDNLTDDFKQIEKMASAEDRHLLRQHIELVQKVENDLKVELASQSDRVGHAVPELPPNIEDQNDNMPQITRMQTELLVNAFAADFARVATFQITNSVGQPKMRWLDIDEGHHGLSHEPDSNKDAYEKLIRINTWYCEQVAPPSQTVEGNSGTWRRRIDARSHDDRLDQRTWQRQFTHTQQHSICICWRWFGNPRRSGARLWSNIAQPLVAYDCRADGLSAKGVRQSGFLW